jgi:hypothetical protein
MTREQVERITSPGIALVALASAVLIALYPDRATLWLVPAPLAAAVGCTLGVHLSLQFRPRATGAAAVFLVETLFWLAAAVFLIML